MPRCRIRTPSTFLLIFMVIFIFITVSNYLIYNTTPKYPNIPGDYLKNHRPTNTSYCQFNYGLPDGFYYKPEDISPTPKSHLNFKVLKNVIYSEIHAEQVTYATHLTADYVVYLAEIVRRWNGPISVAAFVPHTDANLIVNQLEKLCKCEEKMSKISIHFVFPTNLPPTINGVARVSTCELDNKLGETYRTKQNIPYPVNICRNVARAHSQTRHILVSDVQLMPSQNLAENFMKMLQTVGLTIEKSTNPSHVFVLPVFEVESNDRIPTTKNELITMVRNERAVYFHRYICSHCQRFPGMKLWLKTKSINNNNIKLFISIKREYPFHRWEPIYIGTNQEPYYPEEFTWEGLQDKMIQNLEMCLIGYNFIVLDGGFLVHWPGIKKKSKNFLDTTWRQPYKIANSRIYQKYVENYQKIYLDNPKCKLH